jgi:hypothetical protein
MLRRRVMQRAFVIIIFSTLIALFVTACGGMKSVLSDPEWSENYSFQADCDVPKMIDGSMYTAEEARRAEYIKGQPADDSRFTNVTITFREPKDIKRILVRRRTEDSAPLDLDILAMEDGEWKTVKKVRGEIGTDNERGNDIDIRLSVVTDKIRVRVQRASRTASGKLGITVRGGASGRARSAELERILRQPVKLAEIEIYGVKTEATEASEQS